jgi:hypothetical protein
MITEMREPLGKGIDQAREAVAIRGISFCVQVPEQDASLHFLQTRSHHFWQNDATMQTTRKTRVISSLRSVLETVKGTVEQLSIFSILNARLSFPSAGESFT